MNAPGATPNRHASELSQPGARTGRRQRNKLATLNALREAALDLALEHGVDAITVTDIAATAQVSRRTFFNYFATKEDALVGGNPEMTTVVHDMITERPAEEGPLTAVHNALTAVAGTVVTPEMRGRIRARHKLLAAHPELLGRHLARYAAFQELLRSAISARDTSSVHAEDPELLATVVTSTVRLCVQRWAAGTESDLVEQLNRTLRTIHGGLG